MSEQTIVDVLPLCDFCPPTSGRKAKVDGKTKEGPWANMCAIHFAMHGVGFGTGQGQLLVLRSDS